MRLKQLWWHPFVWVALVSKHVANDLSPHWSATPSRCRYQMWRRMLQADNNHSRRRNNAPHSQEKNPCTLVQVGLLASYYEQWQALASVHAGSHLLQWRSCQIRSHLKASGDAPLILCPLWVRQWLSADRRPVFFLLRSWSSQDWVYRQLQKKKNGSTNVDPRGEMDRLKKFLSEELELFTQWQIEFHRIPKHTLLLPIRKRFDAQ